MMTPTEQFEHRYRRPREGRTLIVGSKVYEGRTDRRTLYPDAVGVDILAGKGVDHVMNLEDELPTTFGLFDHIECISVLEHSRRPWLLAANIERLMKSSATLDLRVPFVWGLHDYGGDYFRFTAYGVRVLFPGIKWTALVYAREQLSWNSEKTPRIRVPDRDNHVYIAKTEVLGWGSK